MQDKGFKNGMIQETRIKTSDRGLRTQNQVQISNLMPRTTFLTIFWNLHIWKKLLVIILFNAPVCFIQAEGAREDSPPFYSENQQLTDFIKQALERHPSISHALSRYRAALQKVRQVTSLPDPMFQFNQFVRSVETRVGPQLNTFMISQKFPWFGKLDLKGQVVFKEAAAFYEFFRAEERQIISDVKNTYYELAYIDRALDLTLEEESLLDHYEKFSQTRYSLGEGLQQSVLKIQAELSQITDRLAILRRQRNSLVTRLNSLMVRSQEKPVSVIPFLENLPEFSSNLQELYKLGEKNRHELKATMARIEKNERSIALAKKDYWPDLTVGAGMINVGKRNDPLGIQLPPSSNGKNAFSFSIGINIPIWRDKYHAGVLEATENSMAEKENYLKIRNDMEFAIRDQLIRLETLSEQMELYDRVLLPQGKQVQLSTETGYETGQVGVLDLLDSERFLFRIRLIRERYKTDYMQALTNLERALGTRFPR